MPGRDVPVTAPSHLGSDGATCCYLAGAMLTPLLGQGGNFPRGTARSGLADESVHISDRCSL